MPVLRPRPDQLLAIVDDFVIFITGPRPSFSAGLGFYYEYARWPDDDMIDVEFSVSCGSGQIVEDLIALPEEWHERFGDGSFAKVAKLVVAIDKKPGPKPPPADYRTNQKNDTDYPQA